MIQKSSLFVYSTLAFGLQLIFIKLFEYLRLFSNIAEVLPLGVVGISIGTFTATLAVERIPRVTLEERALTVLALTFFFIALATVKVAHYPLVGLVILCLASLGFLVALCLIGEQFSSLYVFEILGSIFGLLLVWSLLPRLGAELLFLGCIFIVGIIAVVKKAWVPFGFSVAFVAFVSVYSILGHSNNLIYRIFEGSREGAIKKGGREVLRSSEGARLLATRWSMLDRIDAIEHSGRISLYFNDRSWSNFDPASPPTYPFDPSARSGLIIGVGAGQEILDMRTSGMTRIVGAEISPEVIGLMRGPLYLATNKIYDSAEIHNIDGRAFLRETDEKFDVILSRYPDLTKGGHFSHAFAENYLWTVESIGELFDRLSANGQLVLTRSMRGPQPSATLRFFATLAAGMEKAGINPRDRGLFFMRNPRKDYYKFSIVLKKNPFDQKEVKNLNNFYKNDFPVVTPDAPLPPSPGNVSAEARQVFLQVQALFGSNARQSKEIAWHSEPATDDRPYLEYTHRPELFSSLLMNSMLFSILLFAAGLAFKGRSLSSHFRAPASALLHCFISGLSFCLINNYLLRRLNFNFGNPVQSLALVVTGMLLGAAIAAAATAHQFQFSRKKVIAALAPLAFILFFALDPWVEAHFSRQAAFIMYGLLIMLIGFSSSFLFPLLCRQFPQGNGFLFGLNLLGFFSGSALSLVLGLETGNISIYCAALAVSLLQAGLFLKTWPSNGS